MQTIDFHQVVTNLLGIITPEEIINQTGLTISELNELKETFEKMQMLLDLHLHIELCPDEHTQEILLIDKELTGQRFKQRS